ncbi:NIPSNAP family protein [Sphingopyxis sp.]|uniref:NIPSNAP family protein n=1 Tax=Sphingopyxis sp. TaxID=1908224 RepID=UPI0035AF9718
MMMALSVAGAVDARASDASDAQVVELRQYKLVPGARDAFVALFDAKFVDSQEKLGMRIVGQFRDHDNPVRFTWFRGFADMAARETGLNAFYFGPVWQANRDAANPMLGDNDNVLLLKPAAPGLGFGPAAARRDGTAGGAVQVVIEYLWKRPDEGFAAFFAGEMKPALEAAGVEVAAVYVPLGEPNNFPRLPVRDDRKLLVWVVRGDSHAAIDAALVRARASEGWRAQVAAALHDAEERSPQVLRLDPTPRSALR